MFTLQALVHLKNPMITPLMYELIKYLYLSGCLSFLCKLHSFNVYRILSDTYNLFERLRSLISRSLFLDKRYVCVTVWITKSVKFGSSSRILFFLFFLHFYSLQMQNFDLLKMSSYLIRNSLAAKYNTFGSPSCISIFKIVWF